MSAKLAHGVIIVRIDVIEFSDHTRRRISGGTAVTSRWRHAMTLRRAGVVRSSRQITSLVGDDIITWSPSPTDVRPWWRVSVITSSLFCGTTSHKQVLVLGPLVYRHCSLYRHRRCHGRCTETKSHEEWRHCRH